jgi:PIN domain nuclease of toxin-antitoxin system
MLDGGGVAASPLVLLELAYLKEVGRARDPVPTMRAALRRDIGLEIVDVPLLDLTKVASELTWTRDPFDRLLAAHAIVAGAPFVTADQRIRENLSLATWD